MKHFPSLQTAFRHIFISLLKYVLRENCTWNIFHTFLAWVMYAVSRFNFCWFLAALMRHQFQWMQVVPWESCGIYPAVFWTFSFQPPRGSGRRTGYPVLVGGLLIKDKWSPFRHHHFCMKQLRHYTIQLLTFYLWPGNHKDSGEIIPTRFATDSFHWSLQVPALWRPLPPSSWEELLRCRNGLRCACRNIPTHVAHGATACKILFLL